MASPNPANTTAAYSAGTSPIQVVTRSVLSNGTQTDPNMVILRNASASGTVYVGFADDFVTVNGFPLDAGEAVNLPLHYYDEVWVRTASGIVDLRVLSLHG